MKTKNPPAATSNATITTTMIDIIVAPMEDVIEEPATGVSLATNG